MVRVMHAGPCRWQLWALGGPSPISVPKMPFPFLGHTPVPLPPTQICLGGVTCIFLPGVMEYIQEMREVLYDLNTRMQKSKLNVENIGQLMEVGALPACCTHTVPGVHTAGIYLTALCAMQDCSATPLFERKDNKEAALLDLDGRASSVARRYAAIQETSGRIEAMVQVCTARGASSRRAPTCKALGAGVPAVH